MKLSDLKAVPKQMAFRMELEAPPDSSELLGARKGLAKSAA